MLNKDEYFILPVPNNSLKKSCKFKGKETEFPLLSRTRDNPVFSKSPKYVINYYKNRNAIEETV